MTKIKGVSIGDRFVRGGREYTIIDFYTTKNVNGDIVNQSCLAEYTYLNQLIKIEVPFSTVIINKL